MSHEVESMAFAHEVPWHGLGVNVAETVTIEEMQQAAGLDWEVHRRPLHVTLDDGKRAVVNDHAALVRSSDNKVFDVVGSKWAPPQPRDILEFFRDFVASGGATLETAGSLRGGKIVWALANLKQDYKIGASKDVIKSYMLLASPYQQGKSIIFRLTPTRVVCANTMAAAMAGTSELEKRWSHATEFNPEEARESLELVRDNADEMARQFNKLKRLKLTENDAVKILAPVFQPNGVSDAPEYPAAAEKLIELPELRTPTLDAVLDAYLNAPGADPGNGWGVINAVTYYNSHVARKDADGRMTSTWLGKDARRASDVFDTLVKMAA